LTGKLKNLSIFFKRTAQTVSAESGQAGGEKHASRREGAKKLSTPQSLFCFMEM